MHGARPLSNEGFVPQNLYENLPAGLVLLGVWFRAAVALHGSVLPGAEEAVFSEWVEVVHWCGHQDFVGLLVDFLGLEHPEAEAAETGVAGCGVGDGSNPRVGEALPA